MEEEHTHCHQPHHQQLSKIAESTPTIAIRPSLPSKNSTPSPPTPEKLESPTLITQRKVSIRVQKDSDECSSGSSHLKIPKVIAVSSSAETLTGIHIYNFSTFACTYRVHFLFNKHSLLYLYFILLYRYL